MFYVNKNWFGYRERLERQELHFRQQFCYWNKPQLSTPWFCSEDIMQDKLKNFQCCYLPCATSIVSTDNNRPDFFFFLSFPWVPNLPLTTHNALHAVPGYCTLPALTDQEIWTNNQEVCLLGEGNKLLSLNSGFCMSYKEQLKGFLIVQGTSRMKIPCIR